jgi:hypothetical protein
MKLGSVTTMMALGLAAGFLVLIPGSAYSGQSGDLHITKTCPPSTATNLPGMYCTITSSNVAEIPAGAKVFYTEGSPTAAPESNDIVFDSNVVLFVGLGDWAVGRCTLDSRQYPGNYGLCAFSNGVGRLAGFTARVNVSPFENTPTNIDYYWNGRYRFSSID